MVRARCCFDIRRVMRAMVRTYQITMGRAYYKCTLRFSSTSNVTDTNTAPLDEAALRLLTSGEDASDVSTSESRLSYSTIHLCSTPRTWP